MKHTPAPWKIQIDREERHPIAIIDPATENHPQGALHICNINPNLQDESLANARLIAAAPELLKALKAIAQNGGTTWDYATIGNVARVAILKAEGE